MVKENEEKIDVFSKENLNQNLEAKDIQIHFCLFIVKASIKLVTC